LAASTGDERFEALMAAVHGSLRQVPHHAAWQYAAHASGLRALARHEWEDAAATLTTLDTDLAAQGLRYATVVPYLGDMVEAVRRARPAAEARRVAEEVAHRPYVQASPQQRVAAARNLAALERDDDRIDAAFAPALAPCGSPFETARSQQAYGERLLAAARPHDALAALAASAATFDRLGALPWLHDVQAARRAAGATIDDAADAVRLTDQELAVCLAVGGGATTRQAAASLFISPKTVAFHLGNAYRKLGVENRAQLAQLVAKGRLVPLG
jgi:DNA-binding CsgD family transcriptional regulator